MPETTDYMVLGYVVTVIILVGLVTYLVLKARNLRAELEMLETMENEGRIPGDTDSRVGTTRDSASHV